MPASYREIAAALRQRIVEGRYEAGQKLPSIIDLQEEFDGAAYQTVRTAIDRLKREGLVETRGGKGGTRVRELGGRRRITRSRQVFRDEKGYYFDPAAQPWIALQTVQVTWGVVPVDLAATLGVHIGDEVLIRDRIMGDATTRRVTQLARSYLPRSVAHGTVLAQADTGAGGIYDRLEDMGHRPLLWSESVSARMPSPEEAELLGLPADVGVPLLRVVRVTRSPSSEVLEVNVTLMSAEDFEIGYDISRSDSAQADRGV